MPLLELQNILLHFLSKMGVPSSNRPDKQR